MDDLDPIYNPFLDPRYAKVKYLKPKVKPVSLEDIEKRLESLEQRLEYLIQWLESNDKKFL